LRTSVADTISQEAASADTKSEINLIKYWIQKESWLKEYFEQESDMSHLLARKKSLSTLRGKQSEAGSAAPSSTTLSDQQSREAKSTLYKTLQYRTILATKGSFMDESDLGITDKTKDDF
jgi:hypothetical protein